MCTYFVDYENMNGKNLATLEPAKKVIASLRFTGAARKSRAATRC